MIETILLLLTGFLIGFLTAYYNQKGKNKAIREDIKGITYEKETVTSSFTLDIEKRKFQYESKKDQYIKYFNLLDEFNSQAKLEGFSNISKIIQKFPTEFLKVSGNKKKEMELVGNFSETIQSEMLKSNEKLIKIKNETNSIRLIANDEIIILLNQLEKLYQELFDKASIVFKAIPNLVVERQTELIQTYMSEFQHLGNEVNQTKDRLIRSMRDDLNEI